MLRRLTRRFRFNAALALAALYASCVIAPHAALALTDAAAHCLTEPHGSSHVHRAQAETRVHVHADGTAHTHGDTAPHKQKDVDKDHGGTCCGLFCVTALAHEPALTLSAPLAASLIGPATGQLVLRAGPDQARGERCGKRQRRLLRERGDAEQSAAGAAVILSLIHI